MFFIFLAYFTLYNGLQFRKIWNASRICVSSLRRGHANLLCVVPILVHVLPKRAQQVDSSLRHHGSPGAGLCPSSNIHVDVLTSGTSECDRIGHRTFADVVNEDEIILKWHGMHLLSHV